MKAGGPGNPAVLVFAAAYMPGFKAGGPIRSLANLVEHLGDEFEFRIITRNKDLGEASPYPEVRADAWNQVGKAQVWYSSRPSLSLREVHAMLQELEPAAVYVNSFFGFAYSLKPVIANTLAGSGCPVVIAPRGEFSPGALAIKPWKKKPYLTVVRASGILRNASWQATSAIEADHIQQAIGANARVLVAPNLPSPATGASRVARPTSLGALRVGFLSRVSRKKNLKFAIEVMRRVRTSVEFVIQGPKEDPAYWRECDARLAALPGNVTVRVLPEVAAYEVPSVMAGFDLFFLPTRGENFGHVIAEALGAGTPVLVSDQTPWRDLERDGLGWDLPLSDIDAFVAAIERVAALSLDNREAWRTRVLEAASRRLEVSESVDLNRRLFLTAISGRRSA